MEMREDIKTLYSAAIRAVDPANAVRNHLKVKNDKIGIYKEGVLLKEYSLDDYRNIIVVGSGKATSPMALAVEEMLGSRISKGCISVKYGYTEPLSLIQIREASHPIPDENGLKAASEIRALLEEAGENDLVISLISGGGSALMPLPPDRVSLAEKGQATDLLLRSGASIHEINAIRKHLSLVKGGNLARVAYPATVINLMISDVVGDSMDVIASGPFVADRSTFSDAHNILGKYGLLNKVPDSVRSYIEEGVEGKREDNPKENDRVFTHVTNLIVASNYIALKAAAEEAEKRGYNTMILSSLFEGETRDVAFFHNAISREISATGNPVKIPACVISGGETTVTVKGKGLGGRNMEYAIQSALLLKGTEGIITASIGTDGTDGPTDAAGAMADGSTVDRARVLGLDINEYIENSDSYHFFKILNDLIITGPTNTNVMDIRIILVKK